MATMPKSRTDKPNQWAKKLLALREKWGGLTQSDAAEKIGVSRRTWASWELNTVPPKPIQLLIDLLLKQ